MSRAEVRVARNGEVRSARDLDDALGGYAPSKTDFSVFSWRAYIRNFDKDGNNVIKPSANVPDSLKTGLWQIRFLDMWLSNRQGEPDERAEQLLNLMSAQVSMERQVRESYSNIDGRTSAIKRLRDNAGSISRLPSENVAMSLERVRYAKLALAGGGNVEKMMEAEALWTLGGAAEFRVSRGGEALLELQMDQMRSASYLAALPTKVEQANRAFK